MPGVTKRKFNAESMRICKRLKRPLYLVVGTLPQEYTAKDLIRAFIKFYPLEWQSLIERCNLSRKKDMFLRKVGKKTRYNQKTAADFFFKIPTVKHILSDGYRQKYKEEYSDERRHLNCSNLIKKALAAKSKHEIKVAEYKKRMQTIDPYYIDALIATYHKRGNTINDKMEIVRECEKFDSEKIYDFFYRLNDSERNDQIRNMAFMHLQKSGHYVRLRKKFKGKRKSYMVEETDFFVTPLDLYRRLGEDTIQSKKVFDVFISHSYKDEMIVREIIKIMNKYKFHCYCDWVSDNDFLKRSLASEYTAEVLKKRIEQSRKILFVQTENSTEGAEITSSWIQMELKYSSEIGKKIYLLNLSSTQSEFPFQQISIDFEKKTLMWE